MYDRVLIEKAMNVSSRIDEGTKATRTGRLPLSGLRPIPRRGLSRVEGAAYIGVSPNKFDQLRKDGRIGPPRICDGRKLWDVYALDQDFEAFPVEALGDAYDDDWDAAL